jgi:DNA-nicking Smr family endonuclease
MARKRKKKPRRTSASDTTEVPALSGLALLVVETPVEVLDLHGMTAAQAERRLDFFFQRHRVTSPGRVVHIITGKGTRSHGAAVLPGLVRDLLAQYFVDFVAESAGLPGGGGVAVRIAAG